MDLPSPETLAWIKDAALPVLGFVGGFFTSRWTLTKKDRKDLEQKNFENTGKLIEDHDQTYAQYAASLAAYADASSADVGNFVEIATRGDRYFLQLNMVATAILSNKVDRSARDQILLPNIRAAVMRLLPKHYDTLRSIVDKHGFAYAGELRRTDYGAIYDVVERFGPGPEWGDPPQS